MNFLETVYIGSDRNLEDFRLPVQYVNRPNLDFRGFCGTVSSGIVRKGDEIMVLPSKQRSHVNRIVTFDGDLPEAFASQSITLVLDTEIDCSRGDMIVRPGNVPKGITTIRCDRGVDGPPSHSCQARHTSSNIRLSKPKVRSIPYDIESM